MAAIALMVSGVCHSIPGACFVGKTWNLKTVYALPSLLVYKRHQENMAKISGRTVVSPDLPEGTVMAVSVLPRGLSSLHVFLLWPEICFAFILASCSIQMNTDAEQTVLGCSRKKVFKLPTLSRKRWVCVMTYS